MNALRLIRYYCTVFTLLLFKFIKTNFLSGNLHTSIFTEKSRISKQDCFRGDLKSLRSIYKV